MYAPTTKSNKIMSHCSWIGIIPLISVVKYCKAGCDVSFTRFGIGVEVRYRGKLVLIGSKCITIGLWMASLDTNSSPTTTKTSAQLQQYPSNVSTIDRQHCQNKLPSRVGNVPSPVTWESTKINTAQGNKKAHHITGERSEERRVI